MKGNKKMNKNKLVLEIVNPIMIEKGFQLERVGSAWFWIKEVSGTKQEVYIVDRNGMLDLHIGSGRGDVSGMSGYVLHQTLDNPRTDTSEWSYLFQEDRKEHLYEDILKDFKDIIEKNCDYLLEEIAEAVKKVVPNKKHFMYLYENHIELAKTYRKKCGIVDQDILTVAEILLDNVEKLIGKPLNEVENDLIGMAVVFEEELIKQYGGKRSLNLEYSTSVINGVGKINRSFGVLVDFFKAWKSHDMLDFKRKQYETWYDMEKNYRC